MVWALSKNFWILIPQPRILWGIWKHKGESNMEELVEKAYAEILFHLIIKRLAPLSVQGQAPPLSTLTMGYWELNFWGNVFGCRESKIKI